MHLHEQQTIDRIHAMYDRDLENLRWQIARLEEENGRLRAELRKCHPLPKNP